MKYRLVIADVDGTLLPPSELPAVRPSEKLIWAVKKVIKKGVIFSIASARSLPWVGELISHLELKFPIILDNGARIYDCGKKKYIWESLLSKETAQNVFSFLSKEKKLRVFVMEDNRRLENFTAIVNWRISKILVLGVSPQKAEELHQKLRRIPDIHVTKSVSGTGEVSESIVVTNIGASKQIAVRKLSQFIGVRKDEIIGIGDSYNDFPLLMACGFKVAMGNAISEIKAIADYIAPSYKEDGVVDVLEKFILK